MSTQTTAAGRAAPPAAAPRPHLGRPLHAAVRFHAVRADGTAGCNSALMLDDTRAIEAAAIPDGRRCNLPGCTRRWAA